MHILMTRYDLLSKKEYHDKMEQLEAKHKEVEEALTSGKNVSQLDAADMIGVEKRKAMTLAEQVLNAKSKEELKREQKEAEEFIKKMNGQRHEMERRKKQHLDAEAKKVKDQEDKKKAEEDEKKAKAEEDRKAKMEALERDLKLREEQRRKEREETKAKVDEVLNRKPLYKVKEEVIKEMEQSELEKKKEHLNRIRSLHKPIELAELAQHKQNYLELKEKKDRELTDKREKVLLEIEDKNKQD